MVAEELGQFQQASGESLAGIIDWEPGWDGLWGNADFAAILRHRLETPVQLPAISGADQTTSVGDLLRRPDPDPAVLRRLNKMWESSTADPDGPLPREV